jgi:hypothetical protein
VPPRPDPPVVVGPAVEAPPAALVDAPVLVALVATPVPVALAGDRLVVLSELSEQAMQTRAQAPSPRAIKKDLVTLA